MSSLFGIGAGGSVGASASFHSHSINQSLRFNRGDNPKLVRDPIGSPTLSTKCTVSVWFKRSDVTNVQHIFDGTTGTVAYDYIQINSDGYVRVLMQNPNSYGIRTVARFRDPSAWYHLVLECDTTLSTAADRLKIYINGDLQTLTTVYGNYPQNHPFYWNVSGASQNVARSETNDGSFGGYLAEFHFIDGQALDPTSFGETKDGVWIPKEYSGSHGTNGFYLPFDDSSAIGDDESANTNDFTPSNLAATDVVPDSPTNNFATANNLAVNITNPWTTSEGNLKIKSSANNKQIRGTFLMQSGKWYWETRRHNANNNNAQLSNAVGIAQPSGHIENNPYQSSTNWSYYSNTGNKYHNNTNASYGDSWNTAGDIVGVAFDADNGAIWFSKNGTWQNSATASEIAAGTTTNAAYTGLTDSEGYVCVWWRTGGNNAVEMDINFGQNPSFNQELTGGDVGTESGDGSALFKYAPPSGFLALCTSNLPDPTIGPGQDEQADDNFNTVLYTGDGASSNAITGVGFQPDWLWIKNRVRSGVSHVLVDSVRGLGDNGVNLNTLSSDNTNAEFNQSDADGVSSLNSDGFTVGYNNSNAFNLSADSYVAWNWKAGGTTPTKTYKVVVVSDSGNKYRFRNSADSATFAQSAVTLNLQEGGTYVFDWSDSSAQGHPIRFSTTSDGTHGGGTEYTTGVVKDNSAYTTTITVAAGAPTLYYYCQIHSGMGGQVNTNSTHGQSNFDGTSQSVVSANTSAGFSIVQYEGLASGTQTVGHGLNSAPELIIFKNRDDTSSWVVYTEPVGTSGFLLLNSSGGKNTSDVSNTFNSTAPTNSVFTVGTNNAVGGNGETIISYCFHSVEGYSKVGRYLSNNSTDGTFVYLGFRPSWVMIKRLATTDWEILDTARDVDFNPNEKRLEANTTQTEATTTSSSGFFADFLSNGFKLRGNGSHANGGTAATYIFLAFAEAPQKFANAR
tara:strand:+ start:2195 stop:5074 length:2880 start_codon:yes stop_codon:yes gene_type:complete